MYLLTKELNSIQGLLKYINQEHLKPSRSEIALEIKIVDSNGETVGMINYETAADQYAFYPL
jgi:hypothetical protein